MYYHVILWITTVDRENFGVKKIHKSHAFTKLKHTKIFYYENILLIATMFFPLHDKCQWHILHNGPAKVLESSEGWITWSRGIFNECSMIPHYQSPINVGSLPQMRWCPCTLMVVTTNTTVFQRPPFTNILNNELRHMCAYKINSIY